MIIRSVDIKDLEFKVFSESFKVCGSFIYNWFSLIKEVSESVL